MVDGETKSPSARGWERAHIDLGALDQRVTNLDRALGTLAENIGQQIRELGAKIDRQAAKPTDWLKFGGVATGAIVVLLGIATYVKTDLDSNMSRIEKAVESEARDRKSEIKDINTLMQPILAAVAQHANDLTRFDRDEKDIATISAAMWTKDAEEQYRQRIDERDKLRDEYARRDLDRIEGHVNSVDGNLIKRPEIASLFANGEERVSAISSRLNDLTKTLESIFPGSDVIKEIQEQIREMRQAQSAIAPAAPLVPLAPKGN
jgi:DNA repair exonuclease SbcCD ATPase subunit